MPRKGENIHKRKDGRWEGRYIDSYKPDKTPHYKSLYGRSYAEIKSLLVSKKTQAVTIATNSLHKDIEKLSYEWLDSVKIRIKASTCSRYYTIVHNHIIPFFKNISVEAITGETIDKFIKEKSSLENLQPLSAKTIRCVVSVLLQIMKYAEKRQYIQAFSHDVILPKMQAQKMTVLTRNQQEKLVSYIQNNLSKETLGILIALYTGVRLGELCALTWESVDFEAGELMITKAVQRIKNLIPKAKIKTNLIIDKPKSEKSMRNIPIPLFLLDILRISSKNHDKTDFILTGNSKVFDPRTYQNIFKKHIKAAGISDINFHATRHTFATRAIEVEFDVKSLSEILGHSNVRFTLDRYVHSSKEQKRVCMEKMAKCY